MTSYPSQTDRRVSYYKYRRNKSFLFVKDLKKKPVSLLITCYFKGQFFYFSLRGRNQVAELSINKQFILFTEHHLKGMLS